MNFINEINAFEQWLETNYLSGYAQLLWYKLFMLFNKSGWNEWVTVDNLRLMSKIGVSNEKTFLKYRDELLEKELFEYVKGKKGNPNKYRMFSVYEKINTAKFAVQTPVKETVYPTVETTVYPTVNPTDIYKQDNTKQNQLKNNFNNIYVQPEVEPACESKEISNALDKPNAQEQAADKPKTTKAENAEKAQEIFLRLWSHYPCKRGKARVSQRAKLKILREIGEEQFLRCINRYLTELTQNKKYIQNGSTFFNSGYVDFLDENFETEVRNGANRGNDSKNTKPEFGGILL